LRLATPVRIASLISSIGDREVLSDFSMEDTFQTGLFDLRDNYLKPDGAWSTYFPAGTMHTFLLDPTYPTLTVAGTKLTDWMTNIVNQGPPSQVGP